MHRAVLIRASVIILMIWSGLQGQEIDEHPLVVLMKKLPQVEIAEPQASTAPSAIQAIMPGLYIQKQKRIILDATVIFDQGPQDGLEAVACMPGGKNHESMLLLDCGKGALIKSLFIANFNLTNDGVVCPQDSGLPARGYPVRAVMRWRPDPVLEPNVWVERDMSTMVRDRASGRPYPPLPYIYTGSRFVTQTFTDGDGNEREQELFMLDNTKTLVTNYDEPDTLLASPFPLSQFDVMFEVNSADSPAEDTKVELYFELAPLPLTLAMNADGALLHQGQVLDAAATQALLQQHFATKPDKGSQPFLHACAITVGSETPREKDVAMREWFLEQAVAAKVWVVPVFVPATP